ERSVVPNRQQLVDLPFDMLDVTESVLIYPDITPDELQASLAANEMAERGYLCRTPDSQQSGIVDRVKGVHGLGLELHVPERNIRPMRPKIIIACVAAADAGREIGVDLIRKRVIKSCDLAEGDA